MGDFEMLPNSSGESAALSGLLSALLSRDLNKFNEILENEPDLELNTYFGDPHLGTLLDLSCMRPGNHSFVHLLLTYGANPNIVGKLRKKAPLHFAVQNNDIETVKFLLSHNTTNVNILDSTGSTALHYAVKLPDSKIVSMLLKSEKTDVNVTNKKGKSPILCALEDKNKNNIMSLLEHSKLNLKDDPKFSLIRDLLNEIVPDWESYVTLRSEPPTVSRAFSLLSAGKYDEFMALIEQNEVDTSFLEGNNGSHTFLQFCCEFGVDSVVSALLKANVNPNNTTSTITKTPLMIASYKGYVNIVRMLLNSGKCVFNPIEKETVLHCVVKGSAECVELIESKSIRDHLQCLTLLLSISRDNININQGDFKGNTALHYATKQGDNEMVLLLLKAGASLSCFNRLGEPAFSDINYKTLKTYLDSCVYTNDKLPREESYEIILNYRCLKPVSSTSDDFYKSEPNESPNDNSQFNSFECKSLLYIAQSSELKHLLKHPIFTSFLYLKWCKIYKCYYLNLLYYLIFLLGMTFYVLHIYQRLNENFKDSLSPMENVIWSVLILLLFILILRELSQFIISPLNYLKSPENWLEIGIIGTCVKILFFAYSTTFDGKVWLSVFCIMLSYGELVLLIGKHPALSTYIEMLKTVSWNFLKFLGWYFTLIIAFALSFFILFGMDGCSYPSQTNSVCPLKKNDSETENEDLFSSPSVSLFKTVIMLTGEFDAASVPFVTHPGLSHALFIAFLFFIAIVLFNLLNGLAVSDTQAIQSDSELVGYISRVKLIAFVETLVANPLPNKDNILDLNVSSCWETSLITYFKNKMLSKYINLFQEEELSDDCEVRILPFYGNQVRMGNAKYAANRKEPDPNSKCYRKCQFQEMDSTIVHAVKDVLIEKHVEEEILEVERKKEENERLFFEMIKKCNENINQIKQTVLEIKTMQDRLITSGKGGWNV